MLIINYLSGGIVKDVKCCESQKEKQKRVNWDWQLFSPLGAFAESKHGMWLR